MTMNTKNDLLVQLKAQYDEAGLISAIVEANEESPAPSLVILFDEVGDNGHTIHVELSFLPNLADADAAGVFFLQSFVAIAEQVPTGHYPELLKLTAKLNTTLPLGAFGLFEETGVAYFKQNCLIHAENGDAANAKAIDIQTGLILYLHQLYLDGILEVAAGGTPAADVIDKLLI